MISLMGIRRDIPIQIREAFTIKKKRKNEILNELMKYFDEVIILTTCNRTEIYVDSKLNKEEVIDVIFKTIGWNDELKLFIFYVEEEKAYRHLFRLACGYHSRIVGEDQILGQIKNVYIESLEEGTCSGELGRLFQEGITCGKKFRTEAKLFEIPVSSISVAISIMLKEKCKKVMVIGYGEIGRLAVKYLLSHKVENIYLVVREPGKIKDLHEENVKIINFKEKNQFIQEVDSIISCTNAPHAVVLKDDIVERRETLSIFDMAVPRDVEVEVGLLNKVKVYNIDEISEVDDENKALRVQRMSEYKYIYEEYLKEYMEWKALREISPIIKELKMKGEEVYSKRLNTYQNKSRDLKDEELVKMLLKSTSDAYINRAIEVIKNETLEGSEEECLRIVRKIFLTEE